jgi:hypothetical protein
MFPFLAIIVFGQGWDRRSGARKVDVRGNAVTREINHVPRTSTRITVQQPPYGIKRIMCYALVKRETPTFWTSADNLASSQHGTVA